MAKIVRDRIDSNLCKATEPKSPLDLTPHKVIAEKLNEDPHPDSGNNNNESTVRGGHRSALRKIRLGLLDDPESREIIQTWLPRSEFKARMREYEQWKEDNERRLDR
tara:strand:+ start:489 stop:809 length:321 start_codon:yes stop_codon:yes gene_type:complete